MQSWHMLAPALENVPAGHILGVAFQPRANVQEQTPVRPTTMERRGNGDMVIPTMGVNGWRF